MRVAVLVREGEDVLHVADTMNPDRQEWDYDADTLGAFTRHLEAIEPVLLRVGTDRAPAHALHLLRRLLEVPVPITVLEGATEVDDVSEPADLPGAKIPAGVIAPAVGVQAPSPRDPGAARRSELRALSARIDQLRSMRAEEEARIAGIEAAEIAGSIREHVDWLTERGRELERRLIEQMRARSWWHIAPSGEDLP